MHGQQNIKFCYCGLDIPTQWLHCLPTSRLWCIRAAKRCCVKSWEPRSQHFPFTTYDDKLALAYKFFESHLFYIFIAGVESYCCTWSHTWTRTHSVVLRWTRDRRVAGASDCTAHNTHQRGTCTSAARFELHNSSKRAAEDPSLLIINLSRSTPWNHIRGADI